MSGDEVEKAKAAAGGGGVGEYGTFQGPPSYPPPRPPVGYPQPAPPPGLHGQREPNSRHRGGYQAGNGTFPILPSNQRFSREGGADGGRCRGEEVEFRCLVYSTLREVLIGIESLGI